MDNKNKLALTILVTMVIYLILTLPMFIAFFTMDIDTGDYSGIIYPQWLCVVLGLTSAILGNPIAKYIIKKNESNNDEKK